MKERKFTPIDPMDAVWVIIYIIIVGFFILIASCTKTEVVTHDIHDTTYLFKEYAFRTDTVIKSDVSSDTIIQVRHDTLIIIKTYTDSVKIYDTVIIANSIFGDYKGDSVTVGVWADTGLSIINVIMIDLTDSSRTFIGSPVNHSITLPKYPVSDVTVEVNYDHPTSCYVDLAGFQNEHLLTDHIPFTSEGRASFHFVLIEGVWNIYARN